MTKSATTTAPKPLIWEAHPMHPRIWHATINGAQATIDLANGIYAVSVRRGDSSTLTSARSFAEAEAKAISAVEGFLA